MVIAVSVASLVACCALAWWQWERFSSASGTFQNLGYVLQWPLFGLFPAFLFWRMHKLKRQTELAQDAGNNAGTPVAGDAAGPKNSTQQAPPYRRSSAPPVRAPDEQDDELAAYNRYLAELSARDQRTR